MATTRRSSRKTAAAARALPANDEHPQPAAAVAAQPEAPSPAAASAPSSVLQLGSALSIREVSECAARLKGMLASGPTEIDASRVESIDTAGIQLLLAAAIAAQRSGFKLKLLGAHGLQSGAARALGLSEHLAKLAEILP
jgi:anti-anti-sigma regulatory factor